MYAIPQYNTVTHSCAYFTMRHTPDFFQFKKGLCFEAIMNRDSLINSYIKRRTDFHASINSTGQDSMKKLTVQEINVNVVIKHLNSPSAVKYMGVFEGERWNYSRKPSLSTSGLNLNSTVNDDAYIPILFGYYFMTERKTMYVYSNVSLRL
jgi:hypothetical protein